MRGKDKDWTIKNIGIEIDTTTLFADRVVYVIFFETESGRKEFEEWKKQKQLASSVTGDTATQKEDET